MTVPSVLCRFLVLISVAWCLGGCSPLTGSDLDEQKDPHYLAGKKSLNGMDYKGAIEAFEKALEANPRSASAHLELGLLYERMNRYATAVYHFEKHLDLRPTSNVSQSVRDRIGSCNLEIAKTVPYALVSQQVQAGLDRLTSENATLRQQIEQLKAQRAQPAPAPVQPAPSSPNAPLVGQAAAVTPQVTNRADRPLVASVPSRTNQTVPAVSARTHVIKSRDTLASIARTYGVSLPDLQSANPSVNARKLKVGQSIQIPPPKR
jgi:LysM repeat protein